MATWESVTRWIGAELSTHEEGSAVSVVLDGNLIIIFPPDEEDVPIIRMVAPVARRDADRNRPLYLQSPVEISEATPARILRAVRGFARTVAAVRRAA